jgi:hypothetical protein
MLGGLGGDKETVNQILQLTNNKKILIIDDYKNIQDLQARRRIISEINCFPQKYIPDLGKFDKVFITDSNVVVLWDEFLKFTNKVAS